MYERSFTCSFVISKALLSCIERASKHLPHRVFDFSTFRLFLELVESLVSRIARHPLLGEPLGKIKHSHVFCSFQSPNTSIRTLGHPSGAA